MASSSKKKHTFLTIETKLKILERLGKGESGVSLAKIYGVGTSTISDIKAKRAQLEQFVSKLDAEKKNCTFSKQQSLRRHNVRVVHSKEKLRRANFRPIDL